MSEASIVSRHSLKTKVMVVTLLTVTGGVLALMAYVSQALQRDLAQLLSNQQLAAVSMVASQLNREIRENLDGLERVAQLHAKALAGGQAQGVVDQRTVLQILFNAGVVVQDATGVNIAEYPRKGRIGDNALYFESIATALREGRATIGRPNLGKVSGNRITTLSVPVRDAGGRVVGAVSGVIDLNRPNFIDDFIGSRFGLTGGYLLVSPKDRLIVTATDKQRIMEQLPPAGVSPVLDSFIDGREGSDLFVNPQGVEVLVSVKRVPVAGWYVAAILPTAEAFAPIHDLQRRMLAAAAGVLLLTGLLLWWILARQFHPLVKAARSVADMSAGGQELHVLPVRSNDEIGILVGSFNRLIETIRMHNDELEGLVLARTRELAASRDAAESANRAKSAFLANISHELRTPLNHIVGFATLLQREAMSEVGRERLAALGDASRRLTRLVAGLIDLARLEAQQIEIASREFDPRAIVADAAQVARDQAVAKGLDLEIDIAPGLPARLLGDPDRIGQVLANLLENAVKFSDSGRITLRVTPAERQGDTPRIRFEVEDQGPGMSMDIQAGLFQLFHQGDNSMTRRHGGTGVGLVLSRRLVQLMAGELEFSSQPGQGSLFWFVLPLDAAPPA